jgi:NAD(P)-dependent dehydrogenase (short-subunit alcohol dehydrogenase family)
MDRRAVVTGGTRGIGAGLVKAFLAMGWRVHFTGRSPESVQKALDSLPKDLAPKASGMACRSDDRAGIEKLWNAATSGGRVDAFICNAGVSFPRRDFSEHTASELRESVETNLLGPMTAATIVIPGMRAQGGGAFYVMEGRGSRGELQAGLALYGSCKYGLSFLMRGLAAECRTKGPSLGLLSPGMVVTDLLLADSGGLGSIPGLGPERRRIFNILADRVETVSPWLAARVAQDAESGGAWRGLRRHAWLTGAKAAGRFIAAPFVKRDVFKEGAEL